MQVEQELPHLVKLLDDEDPAVRSMLSERFARYTGDVSRELDTLGIALPKIDRVRLGRLLAPGRRRQLRDQWIVPSHGLDDADGDWQSFELMLRLLTELLHDGTSIRPSLPDALDSLSDEAVLHDAHRDEESLCEFLFGSGRFRANSHGYYQPENSDLLWNLEHRKGNPIGLAVLAMLVAQRLNLRILGCNFPAHFLAWIEIDGSEHLVDCFQGGRMIPLSELRTNSSVLTRDARLAISQPCTMREILVRILRNLHLAFMQGKQEDDAALIEELLRSLDSRA